MLNERLCTGKRKRALIERPCSAGPQPEGAVYKAVNECQAGNSPPDTGPVSGGEWRAAQFIHTFYDRAGFVVQSREERKNRLKCVDESGQPWERRP